MTDVQRYWRDKITQLLGWGTGIVLLVMGWTIDQPSKFELDSLWRDAAYSTLSDPSEQQAKQDEDRDNVGRAVGVILASLTFLIVYPRLIRAIYVRWLIKGVDETVIPLGHAHGYAVCLAVTFLVLAVLISVL